MQNSELYRNPSAIESSCRAPGGLFFLKLKAQELAQREGVSLNNYVNAALAATDAQAETLAFFEDRLKDVDLHALHERVLSFMSETESGGEPSPNELKDAELKEAMGDSF